MDKSLPDLADNLPVAADDDDLLYAVRSDLPEPNIALTVGLIRAPLALAISAKADASAVDGKADAAATTAALAAKADASAMATALAAKADATALASKADSAPLAGIIGLAAAGLIVRTGSGTAAARSISSTSNRITVTNGDGVAGDVTLTLEEANINLVNCGGTLGIGHGGTGKTTAYDALDVLTVKSADMASAATLDLATSTGRYVPVTGTTTIASLGTKNAGIERVLLFSGALTLTNSANLINVTGADITTAAGDVARYISEGGGVWRMTNYTRANGTSLAGGVTDAELLALAGLTSAADKVPYFTGSGTAALADFTAAGRALVDDADAAAQRATLGLVIGTNVQAYNANLGALAGLTSAADKVPYFTGSGAAGVADFTAAARTLMAAASAATQRVALQGAATTLTDASTVATDCSLNDRFTVTLGGSRTLGNPTNVTAGAVYTWQIVQDGTGGRGLTLASNFKLAPGDYWAPSTAANAIDYLTVFARSTTALDVIGIRRGFS